VFLTINDNCSGQTISDSAIITVPVYAPLTLSVSNDIVEICPYLPQTLYAYPSGGAGSYSFTWEKNNSVVGTLDSLIVNPSATSVYVVTVVDNCGETVSDTITYTISSPPLLVSTSPVIKICIGDSAYISASATGGYGNHYFFWPLTGETSSGIWVHPTASSVYQVIVSDECQSFTVSGFCQVLVVKPVANFMIMSNSITEGLPISFLNQTQNGYGYTWLFGDGGTSYDIHPVHTYGDEGTYYVTLFATDINGCKDSITKPIFIQEELYIYIPNTFIPDENRINDVFSGSFVGVEWIKIDVFNRWGELVFSSEDLDFSWDGKYQGADCQSGVFTWKLFYRPNNLQELLMTGHVNIIR
jgi:gliding motility-associated-like protein